MRHVSLYDLPDGNDQAELLANLPASYGSFGASVRFFARGEATELERAPNGVLLLVAQGSCVVRVDGIEYPAVRFDLLALESGEAFEICADEIDPAVVLRIDVGNSEG
ncbi:MAG TPA: hypothetical protein PK251_02020 [Candidatus Latescibacteria bacterium]|nr:hypothetical protein [Candidatus Latescibacterota bacterium]HOS63516.1 hypothetical protein [Candidatus Latescibacterota bacterium]HPK73265.1 hypothetical protein [Candidatus Latescibacterota bacterium]